MLIPIAHWTDLPTLGVLVAVAFPLNALRVVSDAGLTSALPQLAGREQLERANSYMETTLSVPYIVGPGIAGALVAWIGAPSTLAIDAVTFVLSAASFLTVRNPLPRNDRPDTSWRTDLRDGVRFIRRDPLIRTVIGFWVLIALATTPLISTLSYTSRSTADVAPRSSAWWAVPGPSDTSAGRSSSVGSRVGCSGSGSSSQASSSVR